MDRSESARAAAEGAARHSYGKLLAFLAARTRDVAGAEDALAEAFAAALTQWPRDGVPARPEAWLLTVARRRAADRQRRNRTAERGAESLRVLTEQGAMQEPDAIPDERLRLMFACAHPAIDAAVRAPLILQTILGFDAATIASAFLVSPATMSQRLVRAKLRIKRAGIPFRVPERAELGERLDAVLAAVYAAFSRGWAELATDGQGRQDLAEEAIWLGRLVATMIPDEAEALGLLSLMLFSHSRRAARRDAAGDYVPLSAQDTALWDAAMIDEAEGLLRRASLLGDVGRYQLEAAVQSAQATRRNGGRPDWPAIVALYGALRSMTGSPVAAVNHAVALAETEGASAAAAELEAISGDPRLADYQPFWAAKAELLARAGRHREAQAAYRNAIGLAVDPAVRRYLRARQARLDTCSR